MTWLDSQTAAPNLKYIRSTRPIRRNRASARTGDRRTAHAPSTTTAGCAPPRVPRRAAYFSAFSLLACSSALCIASTLKSHGGRSSSGQSSKRGSKS